MSRYLLQANANPRDKAAAPDDLAAWIGQLVEKAGGHLHELAFAIGEPDLVMVLELPGEADLAAFEELGGSAGKFKVASRIGLIDPVDARRAIRSMAAASNDMAGEAHVVDNPAELALATSVFPTLSQNAVQDKHPLSDEVLDESEPEDFEPAGLPRPSMLATIGEMPPGSYELVAGRFTRFSELAAFSETVQALPGIKSVTIQQFLRGMVSMRIQYDSPIALVNRLQELRQFKPEVRTIGPSQLEMLIFAESRGLIPAEDAPSPALERREASATNDALAEPQVLSIEAAPVQLAATGRDFPPAALSRNAGLLHPAEFQEAAKEQDSNAHQSPARWLGGAAAVLLSVAAAGLLGHGRF